jgi:hypothetical protein
MFSATADTNAGGQVPQCSPGFGELLLKFQGLKLTEVFHQHEVSSRGADLCEQKSTAIGRDRDSQIQCLLHLYNLRRDAKGNRSAVRSNIALFSTTGLVFISGVTSIATEHRMTVEGYTKLLTAL